MWNLSERTSLLYRRTLIPLSVSINTLCPLILNTLNGRTGKVVASRAAGVRSLPAEVAHLYYAHSAQGVLSMRVRCATSQLYLPYLTPLSVAGCGWLQLGVPHWAASVRFCKELIIDPTFCGIKFSTGRLLAIDFPFFNCNSYNFIIIGTTSL